MSQTGVPEGGFRHADAPARAPATDRTPPAAGFRPAARNLGHGGGVYAPLALRPPAEAAPDPLPEPAR